ncbi:alkaline phosphatase D family protein [Streptomyces europaeiscabiei]|uniref:alkaline phosphatase D family protein n=1 Tax=Streptomyces europaeiscabiei TaxID=146819 RepID=UPI0029A91A3A|nr:alkaline phosphatase D family protein [Streptomyces europaeiscabiei]MDX3629056.1 alkaline phosphatase D family protein [Streptomyces europaeiscabiei]MDX3647326.1 alkaline phosphatase D family protein [Streptomyces europaeiscabiei]
MVLCSVWTGATTDTTARVRARFTGADSATLLVADNEGMSGPVSFGPLASGTDNVITWDVTGLTAGTRYWLRVDNGTLNPDFAATFRTHPAPAGERVSYIFGAAGDAGLTGDGYEGGITGATSDSLVFDTMTGQGADEEWAWFSHLGDLHYKNISTNSPASFRTAYFDNMNYGGLVNPGARQATFFRSLASTYVWDDHDFGANNSDRTSASNPAANQVYREWVPHYTLPSASAIYQSWQCGRVLYVASDVRSARDPNSDPVTPTKTMLGSAQKAWMESLLAANAGGAEALVWISPSRWVGGTDTWSDFPYERAEMVQLFGDTGWLDRMIFMTADMHALSICTGPNNPHGKFPMFMFASMDAGAWSTGPEYDLGSVAGRRQYGTMRVTDSGHTIALAGTGYHDGTAVMRHTAYVQADSRVFALDYAAGHISDPFHPTDDDQKLRNEVTARRTDGGEYTYAKTSGPQNTSDPAEDPQGVGVYDEGIELNVADDTQLPDQAAWRVFLSTVDEDRYPLVRVDLAANPSLADDLTGLNPGDRVTIANPPEWLPPGPIEVIAEGAEEPIGHPIDWDLRLNASPGSPWLVAHLAADAASAGPDQPNRGDTSGSYLVNAVDENDTAFLIHTPPDGMFDRAPWIISAGLADAPNLKASHFPFDLKLGGERVRATALAPFAYDSYTRTVGAGSWGTSDGGQAWTLVGGTASERSVDGSRGLVSLPSAPATIRLQTLPDPIADCEIRARLSVSAVATGDSIVPGVLMRYTGASDFYRARIHFGLSGALSVSVTRGSTQIGSTVALPHPYTAGAEFEIRARLIGHRILARVWRTGTAEPPAWHCDQTVSSSTIDTGQVGCTASAFSGNTNVSPVCRFDQFEVITPQRATVTRSINTIEKGHAADAPVSLAQPAPVPL